MPRIQPVLRIPDQPKSSRVEEAFPFSSECSQILPGREITSLACENCASETLEESHPPTPRPKNRRRRGMTYSKLVQRIQEGYGQGHGRFYQPWLQLHRKNPSPESNQIITWLPPLGRTAHFFSRGEYHTALLLLWLKVIDLREQYPLWPMPHPHPLFGAPGTDNFKFDVSRGLLAIATEAGIDHGYELGSRLPYIATIDILTTIPGAGRPELVGFSSKPFHDPDAHVKWRTLERLELERRYLSEIRAGYCLTSSTLVPCSMAGRIESWLDCATLSSFPQLRAHAQSFAALVESQNENSLSEAFRYSIRRLKLDEESGWLLFRHCAWHQFIDIDPSQKILAGRPIPRGGLDLRERLQKQIFNCAWPT